MVMPINSPSCVGLDFSRLKLIDSALTISALNRKESWHEDITALFCLSIYLPNTCLFKPEERGNGKDVIGVAH